MDDAKLKREYLADDARRVLQQPTFRTDIDHLRSKLRSLLPGERINMKCFNTVDRDIIAEQLTPDERKLVIFSWLEFHGTH